MSEWRRAAATDASALADLERAANLVALAHVFPPDRFPFPYDAVRDRWATTLADPAVVVEVVEGDGRRLEAFLAHDGDTLRHLAVHPDAWGAGLARAAVSRAVAAGATRLWCLTENVRARGLYRHLGWRETGRARECPWPPHPTEIELAVEAS
jgi:GNAT superfamily N-acetyltransferase